MTRRMHRALTAAVVAVALAATPSAGDAAWWPWSKKKDAAPPPASAPTDITPPAAGDSGNGGEAAAGDRIEQIEAEMRTLTGQVEQLTYQVQQLQEELQQLDAGKGIAKRPAPVAGAAPAPAGGGLAAAKSQPDAIGRVVGDAAAAAPQSGGPGSPPHPLGTIAADPAASPADEQPIDLTAVPAAGDGGVAPAAPSRPAAAAVAQPGSANVIAALGDPRAAYEQAYNSILTGDYDRAEAGFRAFLAAHPDDEHAADAQYWLGESLFARGKYREAANEFLNGHKAYPKSTKAPDTLLKLGLSLAGLGERDAACSTYAQVLKQYPQASNALRQRIAVEQASASC